MFQSFQSLQKNVEGLEPCESKVMGTFQLSDIFHGVQFSVDFAASSNLSFKRKQEIRGDIVNNGGILSYILTKQVSSRNQLSNFQILDNAL